MFMGLVFMSRVFLPSIQSPSLQRGLSHIPRRWKQYWAELCIKKHGDPP